MRKNIGLILFLAVSSIFCSETFGQSCPTGLQDCYWYGSLSGSNFTFSELTGTASFTITAGNHCPSGRLDCFTNVNYVVTVTKLSEVGWVRQPGGSYSGSSTVYNYSMPVCSGQTNFSLEFKKAAVSGSQWRVELSSVENGLVCSSGVYFVTGSPL